jgi:hypothetical protein
MADSPELDREQLELWRSFFERPGDEFEFRLGRTVHARDRDGDSATFSEDAMDALMHHLMLYIGTRMSRFFQDNDKMPQTMIVRIRVALDSALSDWDGEAPDIVIHARDEHPDTWKQDDFPTPQGEV